MRLRRLQRGELVRTLAYYYDPVAFQDAARRLRRLAAAHVPPFAALASPRRRIAARSCECLALRA